MLIAATPCSQSIVCAMGILGPANSFSVPNAQTNCRRRLERLEFTNGEQSGVRLRKHGSSK